MSDQTSRLEHAERELRDTREALNRARAEVAELRAENTDLRDTLGRRSSAMLLKPPGAMVFNHVTGEVTLP